MMLQMWSVNFKCAMIAHPADGLQDATMVKCIPRAHRGKAALVPLEGKGTKVCECVGAVASLTRMHGFSSLYMYLGMPLSSDFGMGLRRFH